ncbi:pilus assembly protein [Aeromicrobium sp. 636]|uniref:Pilus assembly protein n=1 Tax=Aeromicrobium senzhongii TaxID=2663859 RepID=A0A8I0EUN2_9ACTN|nr:MULTISPECIES: Tad domain-containing protein [Aeromicrobium]MBC9226741.1 pilus assembly protein [Aeromicrobium senzhongii]MCQ3998841.1 pilus assembly protein [Aeromicrobium sp. 636]
MRRQASTRRERGGATIFMLSMSLVLMLCAGLVVDGGMGINARMRVADDAEQAARAGANAVNIDTLRSGGGLVIDPELAGTYARDFLAARGYDAGQFDVTVDPTSNAVGVRVRDVSETTMLRIIGINQYPVSARATASAATS